MLTHLSIRNIVLIAKAEIPFAAGLCVLTGETGAGKSILLDALGLALGDKANAKLVRAGEAQASVSASFDIAKAHSARMMLDALEIPCEGDELIVRRTLSADGKSKCFVNDQPTSVAALRQLGEALIEIHGQHEQRGLMDARQHLDLLDAYGDLLPMRAQVTACFEAWRDAHRNLDALNASIAQAQREAEYLSQLVNELSDLNTHTGEAEALAEMRTRMMQGEKLALVLREALDALQNDTQASQVQRLLMRSTQAAAVPLDAVIDALERSQLEMQEACSQLEQLLESVAYDPHRLEKAEERLFAIKAAARKYQCTPDELEQRCADAKVALQTLSSQEQHKAALMKELEAARAAYIRDAEALSQQRKIAGAKLAKALMKELVPLKMAACRFHVSVQRLEEEAFSPRGLDVVRFEAATNEGQALDAIHLIASGGELSRFMLALKVVLAKVKSASSLIFDEIDTGTGGAVADAIGARLALLAQESQVLVVTHLPQVAARGSHHLYIHKSTSKGETSTVIELLNTKQRLEELARMLAGAEITAEARGAALKLLEAAG